ncbi:MAG: right-handed parallel beta-helix repeat-containing protein [Ardenticatenaceae bacterium]|nr:right-handed parallel beta-helix repeat-containing protein [Ardenticatenaceae bacterium]
MKSKGYWAIISAVGIVIFLGVMGRLVWAAAGGTAFTYQGYLIDGGSTANGNYDFEFRLYDAETAGNQIGSVITVDDLAVSDGEFRVDLDYGVDIFDGSDRWLEVSVRLGSDSGAYTLLSPRSQIGTTLEAIYAEDEDAILGNEWNVSLTLNGTSLEVTDAGGTLAADLAVFAADRTPIDSLPFTISTPGSYYVTGVLTATADTDGITIATNDVTIDLTGFALQGGGGTTGSAITASGTYSNVHIFNGTVTGWGGAGINVGTIHTGIFESLRLSANGGDGLTAGNQAVVTKVTALENLGNGINIGEGGSVNLVTAVTNSLDGINVGDGSSVTESTAFDNVQDGIEGGQGVTIVHCVVSDNEESGVEAADGATIQGNSAYDNVGDGFLIAGSSMVRENISSLNNGNGFQVTGNGTELLHNKSHENDLNGFLVSGSYGRIDSNSLTDSDSGGLTVTGTANLIIRNAGAGNYNTTLGASEDFNISAGNVVGPILNVTGAGQFNTTEPFANFRY